jgi:hypothetical protein
MLRLVVLSQTIARIEVRFSNDPTRLDMMFCSFSIINGEPLECKFKKIFRQNYGMNYQNI